VKYIPIAGTHGWGRDTWMKADSDFGRMMTAEGFELLRCGDRPFRWSTALDGLFGDDREWEAASDALYFFLRFVPIEDRNIIAHSHGGQLPLLVAASGFPIRSLTTIGTPVRDDIPVAAAEGFIGFHQHIYDTKRDLMGWLGQVGDYQLRTERTFPDRRVKNIGVADIRHSKVLRDPQYIPLWQSRGWLDNIRAGMLNPYGVKV
jgi:hypothetical protein